MCTYTLKTVSKQLPLFIIYSLCLLTFLNNNHMENYLKNKKKHFIFCIKQCNVFCNFPTLEKLYFHNIWEKLTWLNLGNKNNIGICIN